MNPNPIAIERVAIAARAIYVGSVEHKDKRSWLGLPKPRRNRAAEPDDYKQNATICPLVRDQDKEMATRWVQYAIKNGQFNRSIWAGKFPRDIWYQDDNGQYWYGRLTQCGAGDSPTAEYKGWPIGQEEWHENFD